MKKMLVAILGVIVCLSAFGCNEKKPHFNIKTEFHFYKDGSKKTEYDSNEFEINTRIYVSVEFKITKNTENDEVISFEVEIPHAEYYSTKDFYSGEIEPKENLITMQDDKGNSYTVMELSQMNFIFDDDKEHSFDYVFEIEANQKCELSEFKVKFEPENDLDVMVNGKDTKVASVEYTFK